MTRIHAVDPAGVEVQEIEDDVAAIADRQDEVIGGGVDRVIDWKCPFVQPARLDSQKPRPKAGNNTGRSLNDL
jgi:hypothetical protein